MYEENNNNALLWVITVVNILILIILATFFAMSWDVIKIEEATQTSDAQPADQQQQADKPALSASEKECMDECVQGGEIAPKCLEECGIELPPKN